MEDDEDAIELPELDRTILSQDIVADNIRALESAYFAAMLDEMKVFQVVDRLVGLFQSGRLPIGQGRAGGKLFKYWKSRPQRVSEAERRGLYGRAFGFPGGDESSTPNREFADLWLRFVSAVSSLERQGNAQGGIPDTVAQDELKKAASDLAANLSLHGFGWVYFASRELQSQIGEIVGILSEPEIRSAYGAQDMWQVIDQVAQLELGGVKNVARYRTMATSGATIIAWLARNKRKLSPTALGPILKTATLPYWQTRRTGNGLPTNPNDTDLLRACNDWLAAMTKPS